MGMQSTGHQMRGAKMNNAYQFGDNPAETGVLSPQMALTAYHRRRLGRMIIRDRSEKRKKVSQCSKTHPPEGNLCRQD